MFWTALLVYHFPKWEIFQWKFNFAAKDLYKTFFECTCKNDGNASQNLTVKETFQGCAPRKIILTLVLWTCEIQGAPHVISMQKLRFPSHPRANVRRQGHLGAARVARPLGVIHIWTDWIFFNTSWSTWTTGCFRNGWRRGNRLQCTSATFNVLATAATNPTAP